MPNQQLTFNRSWSVSSAFSYSVSFPEGTTFSGFAGESLVIPLMITMDNAPEDYSPEDFIFSAVDLDSDLIAPTITPPNFVPTTTGTSINVEFIISSGINIQQTVSQSWLITNAHGTHPKTGTFSIEMVPSFQGRKEDGALTPIIHNGDVIRVLTGATGLINNKNPYGMWLGYIDRKFYNEKYLPDAKFYFEKTNIAKPGEFDDEFTFLSEHNGGGYTTDTRFYRLCFIYDGNQRGMLGNTMLEKTYTGTVAPTPPATTPVYVPKYGKLKWKGSKAKMSKRITEIECYRSAYKTHGWERIANIPIADTKFSKSGAEQGETTTLTFTGTVKYDKVYSTDGTNIDNLDPMESHPVFGLGDGDQSHFKIYYGDEQIRDLDTNRRRGTGQVFDNWDSEYQNVLNLQKCNGTTESFELITDVLFHDTNDRSKTLNANLSDSDVSLYNWKLDKKDISIFDDPIQIESHYWSWGFLFIGAEWVKGCGCHTKTIKNCYGGKRIICTTATTGTENALVGKALGDGTGNQRLIVANKGNFILVDYPFAESAGTTFTVLEDVLAIEYEVTNDVVEITFNDQNQNTLGGHPLDTEVSIDVNGDYAKMVNGRLFQGNIVLDPFGAQEKHTDWVSYSELGQPDVNPVSNVVRFVDREGGSITGLEKIMNRLVVLKEQAMFMINCPANAEPSSWSQVESIHNIGNIASRGVISSGDQLFTVFYDGIYKLTANNLADSDKTPTERLKITNQIQDIYDDIHDKRDITSAYDQYNNEVLFTWTRGAKNLIKNGSFHSQKYWDFNAKAELGMRPNSTNGQYSAMSFGMNSTNNPSEGAFYSDYIDIKDTEHYCISMYARCLKYNEGFFYANFLFYNKQKERIGGYPSVCRIESESDVYTRHYKNLRPYNDTIFAQRENPSEELQMPQGAKYVRCRSYWWSNSNLPFPDGWGETDDWMLEKTTTSITTPSTYETQESKQEIWAYSLVDGSWRRINVESQMGFLTVDEKANVLGYDEQHYKIRAFSEPEAVVAKIVSHPILINEDRTDVVRKVKAKFNSSDDLTIKVTPDGDTANAQTRTLTGSGIVKSERKRVKSRCQTFEIEIETPDSTNEMEIHSYSVDYT